MKLTFTRFTLLAAFFVLLIQCKNEPAVLNGSNFFVPEKKFIELPNGETYAYISGADDDQMLGYGKTVILLHGNLASSVFFTPLLEYLKDVHVIMPDLRGFGDSSYKNRISKISELAEDIKLFTEALDISQVHVVGWSLSGGVAMELALMYPDLVLSLFIIQGMSHKGIPVFGGTYINYYPYSSREEMAGFFLYAPQIKALEEKNADYFRKMWDTSVYTNNKPTAAESRIYIKETLKQRNLIDIFWAIAHFNLSDQHNGYVQGTGTIGDIKNPVTFTNAQNEKVIFPSTIIENAAAIPGSKLLFYSNTGHSPMIDIPDRLAADILENAGIN